MRKSVSNCDLTAIVQINSLDMYVNIAYIFGFIDAIYQADLVIDSAVGIGNEYNIQFL